MNIEYRKAKADDMPFILDILNKVSGDIENIDAGQFLIAEDENKIVGCVRIQNMDGYLKLDSLAVVPSFRRIGIGSALILKILNKATKKPVYLFCSIKNESFYEKFGFKRIKIDNISEVLKKDYDNLLNLKFAKNTKILIAMGSVAKEA
jgi:N-acetylglutamate synthase-like GNAT family acetyltransferase